MVASAYEPLEPKFNKFRAPVDGHYKIRVCAHSFWAGPESPLKWWRPSQKNVSAGRTREPVSLYSEAPPRQMRKLGTFEVGPEPTIGEMDVVLLKGETIRPDAVRFFRSRPGGFRNPLATPEGQPGVTFRYLEVVGPINAKWPTPAQKLLFGDLPVKADTSGKPDRRFHRPRGGQRAAFARLYRSRVPSPHHKRRRSPLCRTRAKGPRRRFDVFGRADYGLFRRAVFARFCHTRRSPRPAG